MKYISQAINEDDVQAVRHKGSRLSPEAVNFVVALVNTLGPIWTAIAEYNRYDSLPLAAAAPWWFLCAKLFQAMDVPDEAPALGIVPGKTQRAMPLDTLVHFVSSIVHCFDFEADFVCLDPVRLLLA
jgi:hypothetical protein